MLWQILKKIMIFWGNQTELYLCFHNIFLSVAEIYRQWTFLEKRSHYTCCPEKKSDTLSWHGDCIERNRNKVRLKTDPCCNHTQVEVNLPTWYFQSTFVNVHLFTYGIYVFKSIAPFLFIKRKGGKAHLTYIWKHGECGLGELRFWRMHSWQSDVMFPFTPTCNVCDTDSSRKNGLWQNLYSVDDNVSTNFLSPTLFPEHKEHEHNFKGWIFLDYVLHALYYWFLFRTAQALWD